MAAGDGEFYQEKGQDPSLSREERMLEFELESLIHKVEDSVRLRRATYATPEFRPALPALCEV
eukprot:gene27507-32631_t